MLLQAQPKQSEEQTDKNADEKKIYERFTCLLSRRTAFENNLILKRFLTAWNIQSSAILDGT